MICVCVWVQFRLVMQYLSEMTEEQTLVMYSGHPMGLFPSLPSSPRAIITNGMVTAQHSSDLITWYLLCTDIFTKGFFASLRLFQIIPPKSSMKRCLPLVCQCKFLKVLFILLFTFIRKKNYAILRLLCGCWCLDVICVLLFVPSQVRSNDSRQLLLHWTSRDCSWHTGLWHLN